MTIACLVTAHGFANAPNGIIFNLTEQERPPDTVYLALSEVPHFGLAPASFPVLVSLHPNRADYGYEKRRVLLPEIDEDFVAFVCHDDTYDPRYLKLVAEGIEEGYDVIYCSWNDIPDCTFAACSSTLGNFVVRTALAQAVSFESPGDEGLCDAFMIERLKRAGAKVKRLDDLLYFHNIPRFPIKVSNWGRLETPVRVYGA